MKFILLIFCFCPTTIFSKEKTFENSSATIQISWSPVSTPKFAELLGQDNLQNWWKNFCQDLSKRLVHGSAIMGTGPFESGQCASKDTAAEWNLILKEEGEKLIFQIFYQKKKKSEMYLNVDAINKEFLTTKDAVDLIGYGLIDQLPFLGFVNYESSNKDRVFLQYKTPSAVNEFLPTKLIFYDLGHMNGSDPLSASVHLINEVEVDQNQFIVKNPRMHKILKKVNFTWFHNPNGIATASSKVQSKLIEIQNLAIAVEKAKHISEFNVKKFILTRVGKQISQADAVQKKAWLVGLQAEFGTETFPGFQFSYDYSFKTSYESEDGSVDLQWQRAAVGKSFTKRFESSALDLTPRLRVFTYKSNLVTSEDGNVVGISNFDIKNCLSAVLEFGYETDFNTDWARFFYSYGASPQAHPSARVSAHHFGGSYFHPLSDVRKAGRSSSLLLNFFIETEKLTFAKELDDDSSGTSFLTASSTYAGIGLGLSW